MSKSTKNLLLAILMEKWGEFTVKELAQSASLSESRVREVLKEIQGIKTDGARPAKFWVETPMDEDGLDTETPTETPMDEDGPDTETWDYPGCPFCSAPNCSLTAAGPEGTFLGDSVYLCHECGRAHHIFTKEEVNLPGSKTGKGKGRRILNPQYKINAKIEAVKAVGGTLEYDRPIRTWWMTLPGKQPVKLSSREFSTLTPETLIS
jgi:hypothetical protein